MFYIVLYAGVDEFQVPRHLKFSQMVPEFLYSILYILYDGSVVLKVSAMTPKGATGV